MNIFQGLHSFQFHDDFTRANQVKPMKPDVLIFEDNVDLPLFLEGNVSMPESHFHGPLIYAFQEARSQSLVYRYGGFQAFSR